MFPARASWAQMGVLLLLGLVALAWPSRAQAAPVTIRIQVIEATKTGAFDPRLAALKDKIPGFDGAKLMDELETKVEPGASVSLEILDKKRVLKVTVEKLEPNGTVKLKLEIEAFKFAASTTHLRDRAMTIVGKKLDKDTSLYLAVTTRAAE